MVDQIDETLAGMAHEIDDLRAALAACQRKSEERRDALLSVSKALMDMYNLFAPNAATQNIIAMINKALENQ